MQYQMEIFIALSDITWLTPSIGINEGGEENHNKGGSSETKNKRKRKPKSAISDSIGSNPVLALVKSGSVTPFMGKDS